MLVAEDEDGHHEAIAVVGTIAEAEDFRRRMRRIEADEDAGICPSTYKLWARGIDGSYRLACELTDVLK